MNSTNENRIERYLTDKMSLEERKDFENQLRSDSDFAQEFERTKNAHAFIQVAGRMDLKTKLESFDKELKTEEDSRRSTPIWIKQMISIAAILIVAIGVYQFIIKNSLSNEEIYAKYFENYKGPDVLRSTNDTLVNWKQAVDLYHNKKYSQAIPYFEKAKVPSHITSFYMGVSNMSKEVPDYQNALQKLNKVLESDNDFYDQALWYKGLVLLKLNEEEKALTIFNAILDHKRYKLQETEEVIALLKK